MIVRGRVQGVGFRWFVVHAARDLDVRGTVRNRPDGAVEAVFQAHRPEAIETLIERVRQGPWPARVREVEVEAIGEPGRAYEEMTVVP